jgi:hypothetical protein
MSHVVILFTLAYTCITVEALSVIQSQNAFPVKGMVFLAFNLVVGHNFSQHHAM